jgi:hypothetical protein
VDQKATRKADRVDAEVWFLRAQFAFAVETWGTASIHIDAGSDPTKIVVAAARRHPRRCRRARPSTADQDGFRIPIRNPRKRRISFTEHR